MIGPTKYIWASYYVALGLGETPKVRLRAQLTLFDATNLVVGATIGADIYVISSFGAQYLGPASLLAWVAAGIIAIAIALCFALCEALLPRTGGPYAYAKRAWGPFAGFIVGWSLWLAEWTSLAVFPIAFVRYVMFFLPGLDSTHQAAIKVLYVAFLVVTNVAGAKAAGRMNDVLTFVKIAPLILFIGIGSVYMMSNPSTVVSNLSPFVPYGFANAGAALVLIFWAYAGFEISSIPAAEVEHPRKTLPLSIMIGMSIVTVFYLAVNVVLFAVRPWYQLALDTTPLASAAGALLGTNSALALVGGGIVGAGALVSVAGADESGMLGTSRLGYALAVDGLFPRFFAELHPRYKTPYLGIIVQAVTALVASMVADLSMLISTSVFLLAIAYTATSLSIFPLRKESKTPESGLSGSWLIPVLGVISSIYLITQCSIVQIAAGLALIAIGIPIYIWYSPKKEMKELREAFLSRDSVLQRTYQQEHRFLANVLRHIKRLYRRITRREHVWVVTE